MTVCIHDAAMPKKVRRRGGYRPSGEWVGIYKSKDGYPMRNRDMEKTLKMRGLKLLHYCVTIALFIGCWRLFYWSRYSVAKHLRGNMVLYAFYSIVLFLLNRTYDAYDVGYHRVSDNIYAQSLSQVLTTVMLWVISLLMYMKVTNPVPLIGLCVILLFCIPLFSPMAAARGFIYAQF